MELNGRASVFQAECLISVTSYFVAARAEELFIKLNPLLLIGL